MDLKKSILITALAAVMVLTMAGCTGSELAVTSTGEKTTRPADWTEETHSNNIEPNYEVVFPQDKVNRITITISPENWEAMQSNITELLGTPGQRDRQPIVPGFRPNRGWLNPDAASQNAVIPRAPGIPGWIDMTPENPMWVTATIEFNGLTWTNVGVRYKGNSSLNSGWNGGSLKLPLKLDFDQFEDEYPEIKNQRFYGFKQMSLSNAFADATYMRDTLASDILSGAGLPAAETAYYEVVLDYGEGEKNLGLYIAVEVVDDTVIERVFGDDSGNIYEGDGPGTSLAAGTFDLIQPSFAKENNNKEADWSDIENLYNVLQSTERTSDPEAWRKNLESIFDTDVFLEWLALSAIMQHWDTYGSMTHNFYLYHDPDTDHLIWISWDHNQVLAGGGMGGIDGARAPLPGINRTVTFDKKEVGKNWPLIRYLLDDPVYYERYVDYIEKAIDGTFNPDKLEEKCRELMELIEPYATKNTGQAAFEKAVQELINRIDEQYQAAAGFLAEEGR